LFFGFSICAQLWTSVTAMSMPRLSFHDGLDFLLGCPERTFDVPAG
jgi:hypothetical protein